MSSRPMRPGSAHRGAALAASTALLAALSPAEAQDLGGGSIDIEVRIPDPDPERDDFRLASDEEMRRFFNLAGCVCNEEFQARLQLSGDSGDIPGEPVHIYVGDDCDDFSNPDRHDERCQQVDVIEDVRTLRGSSDVLIPAGDFMYPNQATCEVQTDTSWLYVLVEDREESDPQLAQEWSWTFDTQAPPNVSEAELSSAQNAAQLKWELPEGRADDLHEYQVLCARADGGEGDEDFGDEPRYTTASRLCEADDGVRPEPLPVRRGVPAFQEIDAGPDAPDAGGDVPDAGPGGPDAGPLPGDLPDELLELDPGAICATATGGTRTSLRVDGLENNVPYHIVLVAIDQAENPNPMFLGEVVPRPAIDYWDEYKEKGGSAEGGFCFVATASFGDYDSPNVLVLRELRDDTLAHFALGRAFIDWYYEHGPALAAFIDRHPVLEAAGAALLMPVVVAAAIWNSTGLIGLSGIAFAIFLAVFAGRRARRQGGGGAPRGARPRSVVVVAALILTALPIAGAHAQRGWSDTQEPVDPPGPPEIRWNSEIKLGGYFPAMDQGFDGEGPFEEMFGSSPFLLGKLTVDRFFFYPAGQLGLTASIGYFSESAKAFATVDEEGSPCLDEAGEPTACRNEEGDPIRSEGDTTSFRMLPTSIGAVYRYTQLDDRVGIPVVPYGRLGLSYYLWWASQPDGSIAESGDTRARGGSFGWEGSAGIAIRAEQLDPDAARNLRNEFGVWHAGFFGEATYAKVDSFGRDNRLSVGGFSLLGGINFEF